jgi:hypothetical protein
MPDFEIICPDCHKSNLPDRENCLYCDLYIADEPRTEVAGSSEPGRGSGTKEEPSDQQSCPDCGAPIASESGCCSRCGWTPIRNFGFIFSDDRLANIDIVSSRPTFIGRVPPVDDGLARNLEEWYPTVSRVHAELFLDCKGIIYLRDLGSCNGTRINDRKLSGFVLEQLQPGDEVNFGGSLLGRVGRI